MSSHDIFDLFDAMLVILTGCQIACMILLGRAAVLVPREVARRLGLWGMFFGKAKTAEDAEAVDKFRQRVRVAIAVFGVGLGAAVVWYTAFVILNAAERRETTTQSEQPPVVEFR